MPVAGKHSVESLRQGRNDSQRARSTAGDSVAALIHDADPAAASPLQSTYRSLHGGAARSRRASLGGAVELHAPPAVESRRAASAQPLSRTSARFAATGGLSIDVPGGAAAPAGGDSEPATFADSMRAAAAMSPAGVTSPKQARVVAASTMLSALGAAKSRRRELVDHSTRMFAEGASGVFADTQYPDADPTAIADARDKLRRGVFSVDRARRTVAATLPSSGRWATASTPVGSGGGGEGVGFGGGGGGGTPRPATAAPVVLQSPGGGADSPALVRRGRAVDDGSTSAGVASLRQTATRGRSIETGVRSERRHYADRKDLHFTSSTILL